MALIGKIRQNMWFVFSLLGVALVAFMMMDSSPGGGGGAAGSTALSVNGDKIDITSLQRLEGIESTASGISGNALRSKVYDEFISRSLINKEGEDLGIGVSEEELEALLYGNKLSPIIQQMPTFLNRQTRQVDRQILQDFKQNFEAGQINQSFTRVWNEKMKQVVSKEIENKVSNMVSKGIYTPTWMADELSKTNSISANVEYVKVPFSAIADADVSLTDADYKAYMSDNQAQFNNKEEGRVLEYVVFDVTATKADSIKRYNALAEKIDGFVKATNDSTYALLHGGNYIDFYFKTDDLPESFQSIIGGMAIDSVNGPILNERFYSAVKLIDKKIVADSVQLSHVFRPVTAGIEGAKEEAVAYIDSLKNIIESGVQSYDSIAIKYSQDPTSAAKGGDLGYVTQGQFFPAINKVAFFTGSEGTLYTVVSQNGVHLIKITDRIFTTQEPKYKVAFINKGIEPSDETLNVVTNAASSFVSDYRSLEGMRKAANENPDISIKTSKVLKKTEFSFENYGFEDDSREIVKWAFNDNTEVGDVSPDMYSFRDKQFNYEKAIVIPALQAETSKGMSKLSDVKGSIADQVASYAKGKKLIDMMNGKSISELSSMSGATTGTLPSVRTSSAFLGDLGYEPKLIAAIISTEQGQSTKPIVGTGGVYVLTLNSKASTPGNAAFAKQSENIKARRNVSSLLMEGIKSNATVKDKRMDFGL